MKHAPRRALVGCLAGIALAGAASLPAAFAHLEGTPGPALFYLVPVVAATLVGGLAAGFVTLSLCALALTYFFLPPTGGLQPAGGGLVALVAFAVASLAIAILLERRRTARDTPAGVRSAPGWALRRKPLVVVSAGAPPGTSVAGDEKPATLSDLADRVSEERSLRFLGEASTLLASSLDPSETLRQIAALAVPELGDWCSIELLDDDGAIRNVAVAHIDPEKVELALHLQKRYPVDPNAPNGVPEVIRSGRSELVREVTDEMLVRSAVDDEHLEVARGLGLRSAILAPLVARGRTLGALTLVSAESGRIYEEADLAVAEELARRAAMAVDNSRLYAEQARARAESEETLIRIGRLQAVTAALSEALTPEDVAGVVVREGMVAFRAQAAAVFLLADDGQMLEVLDSRGYPDELQEQWRRFPISLRGPAVEALEQRDLVVVESAEELVSRWPHLVDSQKATGDSASIAAPLLARGQPVGVLYMAFRAARRFSEADRAFVTTLARQCTQALERARLYEEERGAREHAQRLAGRLRRLQMVVDATLAPASLDQLLNDLLERLREALGTDTGAILIVDEEDQTLVTRASIGLGDDRSAVPVPIGQGFAGRIAASQTPLVVPDIAAVPVVGTQLPESGITSLAGVPLVAEGRVVGVLHVGTRERRSFERDDLLLLRLIASRAAMAIDRMRYHEREHRIAETLQRSLLPERLPEVEGLAVGARYIPGSAGLEIGGDWYDVFVLPDGSTGIVVGDVVGRGMRAAVAMGRLRNALRAYALEGMAPAKALQRLNQLTVYEEDDVFATLVYVVLDASSETLRIASAGHPPPLLLRPDGTVDWIEAGRSLPVGARHDASFEEAGATLERGSLLVLYTDGLVERRGESIDDGLGRLADVVRSSRSRGLEDFLDDVVSALEDEEHVDDVAIVALSLLEQPGATLALSVPAVPTSLAEVRRRLRSWLRELDADEDEIFDIVVAVGEACSNAVEHPLRATASTIEVHGRYEDGVVSLVVRNRGGWRPQGPRGDRGRGTVFMEALMADVEVTQSPDGTKVRLARRLRREVMA